MLIKSNLGVELLQGLSRVIFLSILVSSPIARAYQLDIIAGTLEGITGLQVPGLDTYDVTFQDGTAAQVFPLGFDFNTQTSAMSAAAALASVLEAEGLWPDAIHGLGTNKLADIFIPWSIDANQILNLVAAEGLKPCCWYPLPYPQYFDLMHDTTPYPYEVFATFRSEKLPEPGTLALLAAGAVGLRFHKTRRQSHAA